MSYTTPPPKLRRWPWRAVALAAALAVAAGLPARAFDVKHPGYVDGEEFLKLAGDECELVEISLPGSLLQMFCAPLRKQEPELAEVACGLEWVGAVIVGFEDCGIDPAVVRGLLDRTEKKLLSRGWERLARVREPGTEVKVLVLNNDSTVTGLVVMVFEEDQIVFTNVAGDLDLEKLGELGERMDIPGLEDIAKP